MLCKYHRVDRCAFKDTDRHQSTESCTYFEDMEACPWFAEKHPQPQCKNIDNRPPKRYPLGYEGCKLTGKICIPKTQGIMKEYPSYQQ